jgi:hypothetical protein
MSQGFGQDKNSKYEEGKVILTSYGVLFRDFGINDLDKS